MRHILPLALVLVSGLAIAKESPAGDAAARADLYAGSLLALDGVAEDLAEEAQRTQDLHRVWKGRIALGLRKHKIDWNPALADLHKLLERDVPDWIDEAMEDAAALWKEGRQRKQERREEALEAEVSRIATVLALAAQDLGCIHVSQFALHEAPAMALGQGVGFTNGVIEHTDRLWELLQAGRKKAPPGWHEESARATRGGTAVRGGLLRRLGGRGAAATGVRGGGAGDDDAGGGGGAVGATRGYARCSPRSVGAADWWRPGRAVGRWC